MQEVLACRGKLARPMNNWGLHGCAKVCQIFIKINIEFVTPFKNIFVGDHSLTCYSCWLFCVTRQAWLEINWPIKYSASASASADACCHISSHQPFRSSTVITEARWTSPRFVRLETRPALSFLTVYHRFSEETASCTWKISSRSDKSWDNYFLSCEC